MLIGSQDYRQYLKAVLEERMSANPLYSLRAFARDLKISPQMLSFVLNKKKGLSPETAAEIAERLELDPAEASYFVDLVTWLHSRSEQSRKIARYRIDERISASPKYRPLDVEAFKIISDWYHYAILELTFCPDFQSDPKWIAERLGISAHEASQALERLLALELLEKDKKGRLIKTELNISASYGTPSAALRKLARQLLQKSIDSLETQSIEERDITNITMAIDPALLPEAKEMISSFRKKLCAFLEQGKRTEVYTFAPSLFRITQEKRKRS